MIPGALIISASLKRWLQHNASKLSLAIEHLTSSTFQFSSPSRIGAGPPETPSPTSHRWRNTHQPPSTSNWRLRGARTGARFTDRVPWMDRRSPTAMIPNVRRWRSPWWLGWMADGPRTRGEDWTGGIGVLRFRGSQHDHPLLGWLVGPSTFPDGCAPKDLDEDS